jgi:hypothetical protein
MMTAKIEDCRPAAPMCDSRQPDSSAICKAGSARCGFPLFWALSFRERSAPITLFGDMTVLDMCRKFPLCSLPGLWAVAVRDQVICRHLVPISALERFHL